MRPGALASALGASVLAAALATPAAAQEGCRTVRGPELEGLRSSVARQRSLRDSVARILSEAGAYDSTGALLVWTDAEERKTRMALVNLDPPREAYYRIRGLLAGHFRGRPPEERNATVDLDAPRIGLRDDTVRVCANELTTNDRDIREYMRQAIRRHPDFQEYNFEERATVRMFVDWRGRVLHAVLADSTGDAWLDRVVPLLALEMEIRPASVAGVPRGRWLTRTFRFRNTVTR